MKKEYIEKLEKIRSYYQTGDNRPSLTSEQMLEMLIDSEFKAITDFHFEKDDISTSSSQEEIGSRRHSGIFEKVMSEDDNNG